MGRPMDEQLGKVAGRLRVNRDELVKAVAILRKNTSRRVKEMVLSHESGILTIDCGEIATAIPAWGTWPGVGNVSRGFLMHLTKLVAAGLAESVVEIEAYPDVVCLGPMKFICRWSPGPASEPHDPPAGAVSQAIYRRNDAVQRDKAMIDPEGRYPSEALGQHETLAIEMLRDAPGGVFARTRDVIQIEWPDYPGITVLITEDFLDIRFQRIETTVGYQVRTTATWKRIDHSVAREFGLGAIIREARNKREQARS